jgi:hypothetical protein
LARPSGRGPSDRGTIMRDHGAQRSIIRSELDVKGWLEASPSVDAVRPGRCPRCGGAGSPPGLLRGLHGHGLRERQFRGPGGPGASPAIVVLAVRRYRCQPCGAVVTVVPRETATGRLYTTSAVAWALALFGVARLPAAHVRRSTSPWRVVGAAAVRRWVTLRRWVAAVVEGRLFCRLPRPPNGCDARQAAGRIAIAVSAHAPPTLASVPLPARAFFGAVHLT